MAQVIHRRDLVVTKCIDMIGCYLNLQHYICLKTRIDWNEMCQYIAKSLCHLQIHLLSQSITSCKSHDIAAMFFLLYVYRILNTGMMSGWISLNHLIYYIYTWTLVNTAYLLLVHVTSLLVMISTNRMWIIYTINLENWLVARC